MLKRYFWDTLDEQARKEALARPASILSEEIISSCRAILADVKAEGDAAVRRYTQKFDKIDLADMRVSEQELADADNIPQEIKDALSVAYKNIRSFHEAQKPREVALETFPGVQCRQVYHPLDAVGLYIAGGSAPLFSTMLMLGIPSQIAGCERRIVCSPPGKDGSINPITLYAAKLCGISEIYKIGGVQAIGAMAFGTQTVPRVAKICGPGSPYILGSKLLVSSDPDGAAIDLPAGPSEVLVIADESADASFIAADLLSQAEHGPDSQVILATDSEDLAERTDKELRRQLAELPRRALAETSIGLSKAFITSDLESCVAISNAYAPEHLIINTRDPQRFLPQVRNAGSVFLGAYTPEVAGDYASGTNHALPTYGYGRNFGGVTLQTFLRSMSVQEISREGLQGLGKTIQIMAEAEGLDAHARAVKIRLENAP